MAMAKSAKAAQLRRAAERMDWLMANARMCGKCRIDVLKVSLTDETSLCTSILSAFLARSSVETYLTADLIDHAL